MSTIVRLMVGFSVAFAMACGLSAGEAKNLFPNASFEEGQGDYRMDKGNGTDGGFTIDTEGGLDGPRCARVTVGTVGNYGVQVGQIIRDAGQKGKTYTFAVLAKSTKDSVNVRLEIERSAKPWDRAARSEPAALTKDKWTEIHATFQVDKDFDEGWFAYVSCNQANSEFLVDAFRLYEGDYVPFEKTARETTPATPASPRSATAGAGKNLFSNPSFEDGREGWNPGKAGKTEVQFAVDGEGGFDGPRCARLTLGAVEEWGVQFGQTLEGGQKGKTYTFAAFLKSAKDPATVRLEIERSAKPWDRAVATERLTVTKDKWTEFHKTFTVAKDFTEGWFAYISCNQANSEFLVDAVRLYEGEYVPFQKVAKEVVAAAGVSVFDTGTPSAAPLSPEAVGKKEGWTKLAEDDTAHKFKGDAVLANDRLVAVFRRNGPGAELYANGPKGFVPRAVLAPATNGGVRLAGVAIAKNTQPAVALDTEFKLADGTAIALQFELPIGQPFVQTVSSGTAKGLRVEAPCRFIIMPDFFADDIIADATEIPAARGELPSEHFLLHLLGEGDALVMTVAKSNDKEAQVTVEGQGADRRFRSSEIDYGTGKKVWVAVLEAPGIWHRYDVKKEDADKTVRLDWKAPFAAQWRMDWRRADNKLTDSWEMVAERKSGGFERQTIFGRAETLPANRQRWTTVLGSFKYPCWLDQSGQAFIQPLRGAVRFEGPATIYPLRRVSKSPLDCFTVADIMKNTLGVGPCEHILDVEGRQGRNYGRATCSTRDTLCPIYAAKQQKAKKAEIEKVLQDVMIFVKFIRSRIEGYVEFGHGVLTYLDEQKKAHPELAGFCDEMATLTRSIDAYYARRKEEIKTPDYVQGLTDRFRKELMDYEGPDALDKCKEITAAIVVVGGSQDELAGECRMATRLVRQRAGLAMAADPRVAEMAKEIRQRAQAVLRNPAGHESPQH